MPRQAGRHPGRLKSAVWQALLNVLPKIAGAQKNVVNQLATVPSAVEIDNANGGAYRYRISHMQMMVNVNILYRTCKFQMNRMHDEESTVIHMVHNGIHSIK